MNRSLRSENTIRQYLLGKLDDQDELKECLSEQIVFDDQLSEMVGVIEDEIIEDYLDRNLDVADQKAVEEYFLRPPQRKKKLEFASLLRERLPVTENEPAPVVGIEAGIPARAIRDANPAPSFGLIAHLRAHLRTYSEAAVLAVVGVPTLAYIATLQGQIDSNLKHEVVLASKSAEERAATTILTKRLEKEQSAPAVTSLFLVHTFRGPDDPVKITPSTARISVEIIRLDAAAEAYDVRLETAGKQVWSQTNVVAAAGELHFDLPVAGVKTADYELVLKPQPAGLEKVYYFFAEVTK